MLGHMLSHIYLAPEAQLWMRSLQFRLRSQWSSSMHDTSLRIAWIPDNLTDLQWWTLKSNLLAGRDLRNVSPDFLLFTDASIYGWGCSLLHYTVGGLWSKEESTLHINILELWAGRLALLQFQHFLKDKTVGVFAEITTALAFLLHQGGTHSSVLNNEAQWTLR